MKFIAPTLAAGLTGFTRFLTGAQARWHGCAPAPNQRIYFANHSSHADIVLIWAALPDALRAATRPVAGADYWYQTPVRRYIIDEVIRAVLIDRSGTMNLGDPIGRMEDALRGGASLILFPEGTRNVTEDRLLPFKSGIFHLAQTCPGIEFVPTWISNVGRVLPKGATIPIPLLCSVTFGEPLVLKPDEAKASFLDRARRSLLDLADIAQPN
jgi:1-acyl-sn-glycerol-3-phosphate acyltransferase